MNFYISLALYVYLIIGAILGFILSKYGTLELDEDHKFLESNPIIYSRIFWFCIITLFWIVIITGIKTSKTSK